MCACVTFLFCEVVFLCDLFRLFTHDVDSFGGVPGSDGISRSPASPRGIVQGLLVSGSMICVHRSCALNPYRVLSLFAFLRDAKDPRTSKLPCRVTSKVLERKFAFCVRADICPCGRLEAHLETLHVLCSKSQPHVALLVCIIYSPYEKKPRGVSIGSGEGKGCFEDGNNTASMCF